MKAYILDTADLEAVVRVTECPSFTEAIQAALAVKLPSKFTNVTKVALAGAGVYNVTFTTDRHLTEMFVSYWGTWRERTEGVDA